MAGLELRDGTTAFAIDRDGPEVAIVATSHWFQVSFRERLEAGELSELASNLRRLHTEMAGAYVFRSLAGWLEMTFAMAKRGELHVSIRLQNAPDYLNEVRLFVNLEQSVLPTLADQVDGLKG